MFWDTSRQADKGKPCPYGDCHPPVPPAEELRYNYGKVGEKISSIESEVRPSNVAGKLHLAFTTTITTTLAASTVLHVREQVAPLKVVRAFPIPGNGALVHLHNISGGVLGGDQLQLDVEVLPSSYAQLTTTSATRVYRCRPGLQPAIQTSIISVAQDGLLEYLPDPIIPFADSQYIQQTQIELAAGAGLFWWETLAPGRTACEEVFAYKLLQLELTISAQGRPIALERLKLEPVKQSLSSLVRFGPYRYCASFYICKVGLDSAIWLHLEQELSNTAQQLSTSGETQWGVSALAAHGLVVRVLSCSGKDILSGLLTFWRQAKLVLYGQDIVPPRKVY